jgi:hypothetical protein
MAEQDMAYTQALHCLIQTACCVGGWCWRYAAPATAADAADALLQMPASVLIVAALRCPCRL